MWEPGVRADSKLMNSSPSRTGTKSQSRPPWPWGVGCVGWDVWGGVCVQGCVGWGVWGGVCV